SIYRPPGKASDRFQKWTTPHGERHKEKLLESMTKEQAERLFQVSIASIELSTRDSYAAGLKHFNDWCDRNGRSEEERMPAAPGLIAAFLMEKAGTVGASAVNNWMAGLRLWHTINGAEWHGDSQVVTLVRKGVKKLAPISAKRAARPSAFVGVDMSTAAVVPCIIESV
ncbi:hypothetical protein DFP72DRAFT_1140131, partial [Ephemerocybe angulata]